MHKKSEVFPSVRPADLPPFADLKTFYVNPDRTAGGSIEIVDETSEVLVVPAGTDWGTATIYASILRGGDDVKVAFTRTEARPEQPMSSLALAISGPRKDVRTLAKILRDADFDVDSSAGMLAALAAERDYANDLQCAKNALAHEVEQNRSELARLRDEVAQLKGETA